MQRGQAAVKSEAFSIVTILPWPRPEGIPAHQAQQLQLEPMLYGHFPSAWRKTTGENSDFICHLTKDHKG
jgi:hypothetical protein